MIKSFYIHNFKSIKDLTVELAYNAEKAPNGYKKSDSHIFFQTGSKKSDRVVPVFAVYGANCSGKSTVLLAMSVLNKFAKGWGPLILFKPNKLSSLSKEDDRTTFALEFYCNKKLYAITLTYNANSILHEELKVDDEVLYCVDYSKITCLNESLSKFADDFSEILKENCVIAMNNHQVNMFLPIIRKYYPGISKDLVAVHNYLQNDIIILSEDHSLDDPLSYIECFNLLSKTYKGERANTAKKQALSDLVLTLNGLDFDIANLSITSSGIKTTHKSSEGKEVEFDFKDESEGTRSLIQKLMLIMYALRAGKTIMIDDLDKSLHPLVACELVRMFKSKRLNPNNSQLFCNLYNTEPLSEVLSSSEIGVLSYSKKEGTVLTRVSQIKELKSSDDLRHRYVRGDFGGIPFPYI